MKRAEILAEVFCSSKTGFKIIVFDQKKEIENLLGSYEGGYFRHVYMFTRKKIERYLRYL